MTEPDGPQPPLRNDASPLGSEASRSGALASRRRAGRIAGAIAATALVVAVGTAFAWITPAAARPVVLSGTEPPGATTLAVSDEQWRWPVPPPIRVVEPFRAPATPYSAGHRGIDIAAGRGAIVVAPAAGVVRFAGTVADRGVVAIDHGDGVVSAIEPVDARVAEDASVAAGDVIGMVSSGGHCIDCVHFGVRVDGEYVSPFLFLGGLPRAVLLPLGDPG
jgi:murein DD-endopeptidase MepM/ murein hydrolase activator NlpD